MTAHLRQLFIVVVALTIGTSAPIASAGVPSPVCPADSNCDGHVDGFDLLELLGEWGQRGSHADITGDGIVNGFDLLALLGEWGSCTFEYQPVPANPEAWQIALETLGANGPLLPTQEMYDRIDRDLDLIRQAFPELIGKTHVPAWSPNQIIASYPADGENENVNCLLTAYQGEVVNILFGTMHVIQFDGQANMTAMAQKFAAAPETAWAEEDFIWGGDKFWHATPLANGWWLWDIDDGWHDCFDGCDCHIYYTIRISEAGQVVLVSQTEQGMPWCAFPD